MNLDEPVFTAGRRSAFRQIVFYWLPVALYISLIFYVSSLTQPPDPLQFSGADKFYHLGEYGLFSLLVGRAIRKSLSPYSMLGASVMTLALVMIVGSADEYYQSFVPGRDSSLLDWGADALAAVMAQALLWQFWKKGKRP